MGSLEKFFVFWIFKTLIDQAGGTLCYLCEPPSNCYHLGEDNVTLECSDRCVTVLTYHHIYKENYIASAFRTCWGGDLCEKFMNTNTEGLNAEKNKCQGMPCDGDLCNSEEYEKEDIERIFELYKDAAADDEQKSVSSASRTSTNLLTFLIPTILTTFETI